MDVELHEQVFAQIPGLAVLAGQTFAPHITNGQVDQEVVVRLSHLQERLTPFYILHHVGSIAPYRVGGRHVDGGVKLPSRPGVVLRRVACAVEENVVNATSEHQVEVGLHLRQRGAEVLRQPSEGFARGKWLAHDVSGRGGILQHGHVAEVLFGHTGVTAQSFDAKFGKSEALNLRDVDSSVEV